MHNDHIQGILFSEDDRLDLRHRGIARRIASRIASKGKKRPNTRLKKRGGFSGPKNLSEKSTEYSQTLAELAGRLKDTHTEDEE